MTATIMLLAFLSQYLDLALLEAEGGSIQEIIGWFNDVKAMWWKRVQDSRRKEAKFASKYFKV